jgi:hypothetical protein
LCDRKIFDKKKPAYAGFFLVRLDYLAAGAAAGAAGAAAAGAEAASAAGAGAAAGAAAGAGAGLLQATKVTAKRAAIRAERVILLISHRKSYKKWLIRKNSQ